MTNPDILTYLAASVLIALAWAAGYTQADRRHATQYDEMLKLLDETIKILDDARVAGLELAEMGVCQSCRAQFLDPSVTTYTRKEDCQCVEEGGVLTIEFESEEAMQAVRSHSRVFAFGEGPAGKV